MEISIKMVKLILSIVSSSKSGPKCGTRAEGKTQFKRKKKLLKYIHLRTVVLQNV